MEAAEGTCIGASRAPRGATPASPSRRVRPAKGGFLTSIKNLWVFGSRMRNEGWLEIRVQLPPKVGVKEAGQ